MKKPVKTPKKLIIGLVGEKLSGKDVAANYLVKKYGAQHVRFSHLLDEMLTILVLPLSRRNEIDLGLGLRKIFGERVLGHALIKRVRESGNSFIVINGIRMDEMEDIKKIGAKIIYITASSKTRFQRYTIRREKADDASMSYSQFIEQEKERTEVGIPALGKKADNKIINEGEIGELFEQLDRIIGKKFNI